MKKIKLQVVFAVVVMLLAPCLLCAEEDHHAPSLSFTTTQVTDHIWMLQGKGGNIALLTGDQGSLMVDADYKEMSAALKEEVGKHGGLDALTYLINTHWHGDHTQGNMALGEHALIVAHDNVRARLLTSQEVALFKVVSQPYPKVALPAITYSEVITLHINDEQVKLVHYANGHTDGDSVVFFKKANVVHMGDHLFAGFFPFVDVQNGGNVLRMAENVKAILPLIDEKTILIPGHGPLSKKSDLEDFYAMLIGTVAEVSKMKAAGMDLEEMQFEGLSEQWQKWGDGFLSEDVWIGIIDASLSSE